LGDFEYVPLEKCNLSSIAGFEIPGEGGAGIDKLAKKYVHA